MNETILNEVASRYTIPAAQLQPLPGGHFSHVYEFSQGEETVVLRITPPNEELDVQATASVLEWMDFLSGHGAPVAGPIGSSQGRLIETVEQDGRCYIATLFRKANGELAQEVPFERWNDRLFQRLGSAVGAVHALAREHIPSSAALRRPNWDQVGNCFNARPLLDPAYARVQEKRAAILDHLSSLPKDPGSYGLIHSDLHFGNFMVDLERETITLFDFDDCATGWFGMDIAMTLFDVLVLYPGSDPEEFAARFLRSFLQGYLPENPLSPFWTGQLPHFLKLLEIGVYLQLSPYEAGDDEDPWVAKFMPGRKERIEADVPYVDIDFESVINY